MISKRNMTYLSAIVVIAAIAGAVSPTVMAQVNSPFPTGDIPEITGSVSVQPGISENLDAVFFTAIDAALIAEDATDGTVIRGGLMPIQGYLTHAFIVYTGDSIIQVVVDAGNGEILYSSDGISMDEAQQKHEEIRSTIGNSAAFNPMQQFTNVDHDSVFEKIEQKLSEPTGNEQADAIKAEMLEKLPELKAALDAGNFEKVQELKSEMLELKKQLLEYL